MAKAPKQLDELFHDTLKDIYFAEKRILTVLPKMARAAQNQDLKAAFEKHRKETEGHVERLEQVFGMIDKKPQGKTCAAIVGITEEGSEIRTNIRDRQLSTRGFSLPLRASSTTRSLVMELFELGLTNLAWDAPSLFFKRRWRKKRRPTMR